MDARYLCGRTDPLLVPEGGQAFLWKREQNGISCSHLRGGVLVRACGEGLCIAPCTAEDASFWRNYFDLDSDYADLLSPVADAPLTAAMAACPGLRVLRQPFFETICAFISSSHNALSRIRTIMQNLLLLGENGSFPLAEQIERAGVKGLERVGLGYRAPYLYKSACMVREGLNESAFAGLSYEQALSQMLRFPGVGEKVADCVLLFSLGYRQAFPVDVWMLRAMEELYGIGGKPAKVKLRAMDRFGENAGIAQAYLFHAFRTGSLSAQSAAGRAGSTYST